MKDVKRFAMKVIPGVGLVSMMVAPAAFAQQTAITTTDALSYIGFAIVAVAAVGAALLGVYALIKAYKTTAASIV